MNYLQEWWEKKYPKAGVEKITDISEGVITLEDLQDFEKWIVKKLTIPVVVVRSEQFKPFKGAKGMCKNCLRHWCICNKKED